MGYQEELTRLQEIIVSDDSTDEQREAARDAKEKLFSASIQKVFERFEARAEEYNALIGRLKNVVDNIAANDLTDVIDSIDGILSEITEAAGNQN
jgi:ABC-type transporter Mla subunit MlaD